MKFKKVIAICCLAAMLVLPRFSFAGDVDALVTKGNTAYSKGQFNDALTAYNRVVGEGYQSAALFFNMGNAFYKTGDITSAILYYEKAHKLAPGDEDINYNLKYANLKTTDRLDEVPEFFLSRWWKDTMLISSADNLAVWSILFIFFGSGLLVLYFFAGSVNIKKTSFYAAISLFVLGVFTLFLAGRQVSYFDTHHGAIVFSGAVNVKSGPADNASTLFVIHDGAKVNVLDESNGWMKISLVNGNEGWIKPADVKQI